MTAREYEKILQLACQAGKIMLENGGEVYRVEQTVYHVATALGALECEAYAAPTVLMISIADEEGHLHSAMRRITIRGINLNKVDAVNSFSRLLSRERLSLEETKQRLKRIEELDAYKEKWLVLASATGSGGFSVAFGGGVMEFFCAFFIGALLRLLVYNLNRIKLNPFFVNLTGGAFCASLGWLVYWAGMVADYQIVTLSCLMLLVPGMLITNALRDIAAGDLVSGTNRGIEAFFIAVALACGAALVYTFLLQGGGIIL